MSTDERQAPTLKKMKFVGGELVQFVMIRSTMTLICQILILDGVLEAKRRFSSAPRCDRERKSSESTASQYMSWVEVTGERCTVHTLLIIYIPYLMQLVEVSYSHTNKSQTPLLMHLWLLPHMYKISYLMNPK
jgi:hypothetical protein